MHKRFDKRKWAEIIYNNYKEDIRYSKDKQWKTIFYAFALYGAVYYILEKDQNGYVCIASTLLLFLIALISGRFIWSMHKDMKEYREQAVKIRKEYSIIRYLTGDTDKSDENYKSEYYQKKYPIIMTFVLIVGGIFVWFRLNQFIVSYLIKWFCLEINSWVVFGLFVLIISGLFYCYHGNWAKNNGK